VVVPVDQPLRISGLGHAAAIPVGLHGLTNSLVPLMASEFRVQGLHIVEVKHPLAFLYEERAEGRRGVLVVALSRGRGHQLVRHLSVHHPSSVLVAAIAPITRSTVAAAKASGAQFVIDGETESQAHIKTMARELAATLERRRTLPAQSMGMADIGLPLTDEQILWLQSLAEETPIESLAKRFHMSSRTMHRVLDGLYRELGVKGRIGAVLWAERHGLLPR
jgi:DNA-binding NarL/FixJ family response regulator